MQENNKIPNHLVQLINQKNPQIFKDSSFLQAYNNATPEERKEFIKTISKEWFIKMHYFDLLTPAEFETMKRLVA